MFCSCSPKSMGPASCWTSCWTTWRCPPPTPPPAHGYNWPPSIGIIPRLCSLSCAIMFSVTGNRNISLLQGWSAILFFAQYTVSEHLPYCSCNSMSQHTVFEVSDQIFSLFEGFSNKFILTREYMQNDKF